MKSQQKDEHTFETLVDTDSEQIVQCRGDLCSRRIFAGKLLQVKFLRDLDQPLPHVLHRERLSSVLRRVAKQITASGSSGGDRSRGQSLEH